MNYDDGKNMIQSPNINEQKNIGDNSINNFGDESNNSFAENFQNKY